MGLCGRLVKWTSGPRWSRWPGTACWHGAPHHPSRDQRYKPEGPDAERNRRLFSIKTAWPDDAPSIKRPWPDGDVGTLTDWYVTSIKTAWPEYAKFVYKVRPVSIAGTHGWRFNMAKTPAEAWGG